MKIAITLLSLILLISTALADDATRILKPLANTPQNTQFFLNRSPYLYKLKPQFKKQLVDNYLKHYYFPWLTPLLNIAPLDLKYFEESTLERYKQNPGWNENYLKHPKQWIIQIEKNMSLNNFPNFKHKAITIHPTSLRELPTVVPSFGNPKQAGQGYPFDNLQITQLRTNSPIYVLQRSKNGAWSYIIADSNTGWVQSKDIALVNDIFIKQWRRTKQNYVTPLQGQRGIKNKNGQFFFITRIGEIYPLIQSNAKSYTILVAIKGSNGEAIIKKAQIAKTIATPWPLEASSQNIAKFAQKFLGIPYGWGGLYRYRDCSATTRDLFAPFAVWLPRHSTAQAATGIQVKLPQGAPIVKRNMIIKNGLPFFTLLWLHGHILLYIGEWKDHAIVLHSPWGVHTQSLLFHKDGRIIIGRTIISPLNLGAGHYIVRKTWLNEIVSFTYVIPPTQLIKYRNPNYGSNKATQANPSIS